MNPSPGSHAPWLHERLFRGWLELDGRSVPSERLTLPTRDGFAWIKRDGTTTQVRSRSLREAIVAQESAVDALLAEGFVEEPWPVVLERPTGPGDTGPWVRALRWPTSCGLYLAEAPRGGFAQPQWTRLSAGSVRECITRFNALLAQSLAEGFVPAPPAWESAEAPAAPFVEQRTPGRRWYEAPGEGEYGPEARYLASGALDELNLQWDDKRQGTALRFDETRHARLAFVYHRGELHGFAFSTDERGAVERCMVYERGLQVASNDSLGAGYRVVVNTDLERGEHKPASGAARRLTNEAWGGELVVTVRGGAKIQSLTRQVRGVVVSRERFTETHREVVRLRRDGVTRKRAYSLGASSLLDGEELRYDANGLPRKRNTWRAGELVASTRIEPTPAMLDELLAVPSQRGFRAALTLLERLPRAQREGAIDTLLEKTRDWSPAKRHGGPFTINKLVDGRLPLRCLSAIGGLRLIDLHVDDKTLEPVDSDEAAEPSDAALVAWAQALPRELPIALRRLDWSARALERDPKPWRPQVYPSDLRFRLRNWGERGTCTLEQLLASPLCAKLARLNVSRGAGRGGLTRTNWELDHERMSGYPLVPLEVLAPVAPTLEALWLVGTEVPEGRAPSFPRLETLDLRGYEGPRSGVVRALLEGGRAPALRSLAVCGTDAARIAGEMLGDQEAFAARFDDEGRAWLEEEHGVLDAAGLQRFLLDPELIERLLDRRVAPHLRVLVLGPQARSLRDRRAREHNEGAVRDWYIPW